MSKAKNIKLPKRLLGVKVPKALRKNASHVLAQAQTKEGKAVIAAGLGVLAAALGNERVRDKAAEGKRVLGKVAGDAGTDGAEMIHRLGQAFLSSVEGLRRDARTEKVTH